LWGEAGRVPLTVCDLEIVNRGRRSLEIGELGFPFAFNNLLEGYPRTDEGIKNLLQDRLAIHPFIGGAASYLYAQRLNGDPPGLLVFPGEDTSWQFYCHAPASLQTAFRWQGIPIVYIYSQAAVEREGWPEWFNEHTATVMEPGESRKFQTRFASVVRSGAEGLLFSLGLAGQPSMKILPSAVAPAEVGIAVEMTGTTPARFYSTPHVDLDTDSDEEGGFCFVKPDVPGLVRVSFDDLKDRTSYAHLLFIEPIGDLIQKRAEWIVENQIVDDANSSLDGAIVCTDIEDGKQATGPDDFQSPLMLECSLGDALYLAEKNVTYPVKGQIEALDAYLDKFLEDDLQNPLDGAVGSTFPNLKNVATGFGRAAIYPLVANLYRSMARVAANYGAAHPPAEYLSRAAKTIEAMFRFASGDGWRKRGLPTMSLLRGLPNELRRVDLLGEAATVEALLKERDKTLLGAQYPYAGDSIWTTTGFDEVHAAAFAARRESIAERAHRCAYVARSLAPSWWWYGSDQRWLEDAEMSHPALYDKGELCLGPTSSANAALFLRTLERDYDHLSEADLRLAFGGLIGVWSLVRADGAAASGFCPDTASRHFGMNPVTGDIGLALYHYLCLSASYVLPVGNEVVTFGCHFETESTLFGEQMVVRPWDGLGKRIVARQIGIEASCSFGRFQTLRFDGRKRWVQGTLYNPSDRDVESRIAVKGMWGREFEIEGRSAEVQGGEVIARLKLAANSETTFELRVKE